MAAKKQLLFVIPSLGAGGAEKSLVNLLSELDYSKYEVDLFLMAKNGVFQNQLPPQVKIVETPSLLQLFAQPPLKSLLLFLVSGKWNLIYHKLMFMWNVRRNSDANLAEQINWKHLKHFIPQFDKKYDAAVGYLEKTSNYIVADCVNAKRKIGWIHTDYGKMGLNPAFDSVCFSKLDNVVGVSEECVAALSTALPKCRDKFVVVENITAIKKIEQLSEEKVSEDFKEKYILSVGRLSKPKNFPLAIETTKILKTKGYALKWYVIGDGEEREALEQKIKVENLENDFVLLGLKANPYPYIKKAFIYCQPSLFEGKSIAIDEAKILCKPVVATNFSTVHDQIISEKTGLIAEMNSESLAQQIERLLTDDSLRSRLIVNLQVEKTEALLKEKSIVRQFEELING